MAYSELIEEARELSDRDIIEVVDFVKFLKSKKNIDKTVTKNLKRTGLSKFNLPKDFDEHFDDDNEGISELFYGGSL